MSQLKKKAKWSYEVVHLFELPQPCQFTELNLDQAHAFVSGFSLDRLDMGGQVQGDKALMGGQVQGDKALMGGLMREDIDLMRG